MGQDIVVMFIRGAAAEGIQNSWTDQNFRLFWSKYFFFVFLFSFFLIQALRHLIDMV